ncbi:MAG: BON domain-containing protein [Anaerolineales bacterium]
MVLRSDLAERIASALESDARTSDATISVVDDNGFITLTGGVEDLETREAAEEVVRSLAGVVEVVNDIEVEEAPAGSDHAEEEEEGVEEEELFDMDYIPEGTEEDEDDVDTVAPPQPY